MNTVYLHNLYNTSIKFNINDIYKNIFISRIFFFNISIIKKNNYRNKKGEIYEKRWNIYKYIFNKYFNR